MVKQVHQGDQPRLPPSCIASLACVCMMAACPLQFVTWCRQNRKYTAKRCFTSVQMVHTHTHSLPKHRRQHGTAGGKDRRCAVHLRAALTRPPRAVSPRSCHCRPRRGKAVTECILRQVEKLDTPQICPFFLNNVQTMLCLL